MALPTTSHAVALPYIGDGNDDPNIFTLGEIASVLADSTAVSSITSGVTSAAASGALDSVPVSTADSKAVSAASRASIADSKAISGSVNTSVADSKAISVSLNVSIADSKATSVAGAASVLSVIANSGVISTADSKAVSVATYSQPLPAGGRTTTSLTSYLGNNAVFNIKDFGAACDGVTDDSEAWQDCLDALPSNGRAIVVHPGGISLITESIVLPADDSDGRTTEITGWGQAILYNKAPASNPTFVARGTAGDEVMRNVKIRNLIFVGEAGFPNHGISLRWFVDSLIEDCTFNCHGSGIYTDGGLISVVFRQLRFWPSGRKYGSPTTNTSDSAILFDTPFTDAEYAHTLTFDDILVEAGGRGVELKDGYTGAYAWRFGRVLAEGLTGGDGYGLDLTGLTESEIGPLYTEHNTPGDLGDADDLQMRLSGCARVIVLGGVGSGTIEVRDSDDIEFHGTRCEKFDVDNTCERVHCWGVKHSTIGGAVAGYTNDSTGGRVEIGVAGAGAPQANSVTGILARAASVTTGAGTHDDVRGTTAVDSGVMGHAIRWVDAAGTGTAPRIIYAQKSIANDGVFITGIAPSAILEIITNNAEVALYQVRGAGAAPVEISDPQTIFTPTKDNAATYNVYIESGDLRIQNRTGATRVVTLFLRCAS